MKAILLHKDFQHALCRFQKEFLTLNNSSHFEEFKKNLLFPVYPLWSFLPDQFENQELSSGTIDSLELSKPQFNGSRLFFPLTLSLKNNGIHEGTLQKISMELVFAEINKNVSTHGASFFNDIFDSAKQLEFMKQEFPVQLKIFRIAGVSFSNCCHKILTEKWIKLK